SFGSDRSWEVSLVLHPSTGQDAVSQFVLVLQVVQTCLQLEAASCLGSPVLYQLIEKAKEILTDSNIPHGNCVICLYDFKEGEAFTKTSCYHYFHSHCLGRYVSHSEEELQQREKELEEDKTRERTEHQLTVVCPVCREALTYDLDLLLLSPAPQLPETFGSDFQRKWEGLQKILEKQRSKGGIIDPEVESNRFLIHINEVRAHSDVHASLLPGGKRLTFEDQTSARFWTQGPGLGSVQDRGERTCSRTGSAGFLRPSGGAPICHGNRLLKRRRGLCRWPRPSREEKGSLPTHPTRRASWTRAAPLGRSSSEEQGRSQ
uniref:Ring finger protein 25 n=1 Tax=Oryzias melastigma TaxID=30732 RepID=A0A3B3CAE0_ORYME